METISSAQQLLLADIHSQAKQSRGQTASPTRPGHSGTTHHSPVRADQAPSTPSQASLSPAENLPRGQRVLLHPMSSTFSTGEETLRQRKPPYPGILHLAPCPLPAFESLRGAAEEAELSPGSPFPDGAEITESGTPLNREGRPTAGRIFLHPTIQAPGSKRSDQGCMASKISLSPVLLM